MTPPSEDRNSLTRAFGLANLRSSSVERVDAPPNREEIDEIGDGAGPTGAQDRYLFSLGAPRKISESKMKFWPEGSIMTWILSLSF